jgi:transposase-like protein
LALTVLKRVLVDGLTLTQLYSQRSEVALPAYRYRFRQALQQWIHRPAPQKLPPGPLVLLADGLWFQFEGVPWVLYLTALKSCDGNQATFLDPLLLSGKEGATRWQEVIEALPPDAMMRICAVVVDNLPGLQKIAAKRGWALQLCHFHLLLKLMAQRGRVRYKLRGGSVREEIHGLIRCALEIPEGKRYERIIKRLHRLSQGDCGTERTKSMVSEFLKDLRHYRTYLQRPVLGLPKTTNTVESMCGVVRALLRRTRAGSNPYSVLLWSTALIRMRPHVVCNTHQINRKS